MEDMIQRFTVIHTFYQFTILRLMCVTLQAWGFGMQYNPLDTEDVMGTGSREEVGGASPTNVAMRDRTVFATATKLPAIPPKSAKPVSM